MCIRDRDILSQPLLHDSNHQNLEPSAATVYTYHEMIRSSKTTEPLFKIRPVESQQILNLKSGGLKFSKKVLKVFRVEICST